VLAVVAIAAIVAGGIASIAGFGIGSVLTPALTDQMAAGIAVACVSIPHLIATAFRLWIVREHIDYRVLKSFGAMSAIGGLVGAAVGTMVSARWLEIVLAVLLLFVGIGGLLGWTKKMKFIGPSAWIAGGISGFLGGLVGNQGGLRAGAMTGIGVSRDAFVATATATGLIVDLARMPVYFAAYWQEILEHWQWIAVMTAGVIVGTILGMKILRRIPENRFMTVVSVLLIALGVWLIAKG
jgi:uncharacterized membrane protein YfcA